MATSPKQSRFRLSLASLLLVTTCVALAVGLGTQLLRAERRAEDLRTAAGRLSYENRRLRDEYGAFKIEDPTLLYAAQIDRNDASDSDLLEWKWRVYTPEAYSSNFADGAVSKKGFPNPSSSFPLEPGNHTIRLRYQPELYNAKSDWKIDFFIRSETDSVRRNLIRSQYASGSIWPPPRDTPAEQWPTPVPVEGVDWGRITVRHDNSQLPNNRVVLQRVLVQPGPVPPPSVPRSADWVTSLDPSAQVPGFVIWLERVRK